MLSEQSGVPPLAPAPPDRAAVLRELDRLLAHGAFSKSTRCTKLLRHLVEQTLDTPDFQPKERTLAIDVFGRSPDYDTAADPVVRTTANEIRKRLGAYFHDRGAYAEVLIELRSGSYKPTLRAAPTQEGASKRLPASAPPPAASVPRPRRIGLIAGLGGAIALLAVAAVVWVWSPGQSNSERFWRPFLTSSRRVLVCPPTPDYLADNPAGAPGSAPTAGAPVPHQTPMIPMSDSKAVWRVLSVLDTQQKNMIVRTSDRVRESDFIDGPAIIIGGLNNPWSERTLSRLRFQIQADASTHTMQIVDRQTPSQRWSVDTAEPSNERSRIYAVVSRLIDPGSDKALLSIAGIGVYGTAAAAEFLAQPRYLDTLGARLSGCDRNLQLVLSAEFANANVSEPHVEAIHCW